MNLYRTYILLAWVFIFVLTAGSVYAVPVVKKWDVFEVRLEAEEEYDNPYEAGFPEEGKSLATVTFSGMNREAAGMEMKVHAFWDGQKLLARPFCASGGRRLGVHERIGRSGNGWYRRDNPL